MTHYRDFGAEAPGPRRDHIFTDEFDTDTKVLQEVIVKLYARIAELEDECKEYKNCSVIRETSIEAYEEIISNIKEGAASVVIDSVSKALSKYKQEQGQYKPLFESYFKLWRDVVDELNYLKMKMNKETT